MIVKKMASFAPITITLESQAESDWMWVALNEVDPKVCWDRAIMRGYTPSPTRWARAVDARLPMFAALDKVYTP